MILEGLFSLFELMVTALFALCPQYTVPQNLGLSVLQAANFVLPISELALAMGALLAYATASLGYTAILRIIKIVRGSG